MISSMENFSELPKELLEEIATHLNSSTNISRLTSVCSSWRQSLTPQINFNGCQTAINDPNNTFPLLFNGISIYKRSIFLLSPPQIPNFELPGKNNPWVIKVEEKRANLYHLFFPLSLTKIPLPVDFPRVMDMSNVRINDVGYEYVLCFSDKFCFMGDFVDLLKEKVAFLEKGGKLYVLSIHVSGKLALIDNVYNEWHVVVDNDDVDLIYDDVIAFNGDFYAVDCTGRTVLVKVDFVNNTNNNKNDNNDDNDGDDGNNVELVAKPICGGDKKRLVEIGGELVMVDVYMGFPPFEELGHKMDDLEDYVASKSMWFKVFRLDKEGKNWIEVKELGEYVLFLGLYSSFSVSVANFSSLLKRNCIYFAFPENLHLHPSYFNEHDDVFKFHCGGVYSLEDASISYSKLFWPPPSWITSSS